MRATLERFATGSTCSAGLLRLLGILLLIGAVAAGCTSQEGKTSGPSHPTGQTGAPDGGVVIFLSAQSSPGNNQAGANQFLIIVLVQTPGGRPLQGVIVNLLATAGSIRPARGSTDVNGEFRSLLTCADDGAGAIVTATSEGAIAATDTLCGAAGTTAGEPGAEEPVTAKP
jgi:hypothetical protein